MSLLDQIPWESLANYFFMFGAFSLFIGTVINEFFK